MIFYLRSTECFLFFYGLHDSLKHDCRRLMNKLPVIYLCCFATAFLTEILFPGLPNQAGNLRKFQGMGGITSIPWKGNSRGWGSKTEVPSVGDMDIFWNHTLYFFLFVGSMCLIPS